MRGTGTPRTEQTWACCLLHCGARYLLFVEVREMTVISVHVLTLHALDAFGASYAAIERFSPVADRMPRIRDVFRAR